MEWLSQNWVWVLFAVGMIAMHMFGQGGQAGRGGGYRSDDNEPMFKASMQPGK